uniref:Uncharacterized protein n=1 Tax=Aegilops tauschii subsp. strangulata TaxID=200361 RepID=A0A453D4U0_AEGTS
PAPFHQLVLPQVINPPSTSSAAGHQKLAPQPPIPWRNAARSATVPAGHVAVCVGGASR